MAQSQSKYKVMISFGSLIVDTIVIYSQLVTLVLQLLHL